MKNTLTSANDILTLTIGCRSRLHELFLQNILSPIPCEKGARFSAKIDDHVVEPSVR